MNKKKIIAFAVYAAVFALILVLDQVTKALVASASGEAGTLSDGGTHHVFWLIPGFIEIAYCENVNGAMGIFRNLPFAQTAFIISTVIILAAIAAYLIFSKKKRSVWLNTTLTLIIAGAIGNFIDRLWMTYVRDFIHVILPFGKNGDFFPYIFNVADMALVVGSIMLIVHLLFLDKDALFRFGKKEEGGEKTEATEGAEASEESAELAEEKPEVAEETGTNGTETEENGQD